MIVFATQRHTVGAKWSHQAHGSFLIAADRQSAVLGRCGPTSFARNPDLVRTHLPSHVIELEAANHHQCPERKIDFSQPAHCASGVTKSSRMRNAAKDPFSTKMSRSSRMDSLRER